MELNLNVAEMKAKRKKDLGEEEMGRHLLWSELHTTIFSLVIDKVPEIGRASCRERV